MHGWSLNGRPAAAGSGVGVPAGGTLPFWSKAIPMPPDSEGEIALCSVMSFRWDVKQVSRLSEVIKNDMALIVRVDVLNTVSWLNSKPDPFPSWPPIHPLIPNWHASLPTLIADVW